MEVVADGLYVPEGPALLADGSVIFTEQTLGRVSRLVDGVVEQVQYVGGAPNSCVVGSGGEIYVCQNGGVVGAWRSDDPRTPSIQVISGELVTEVAHAVGANALVAPNDLCFGPDGRLYFTDPAQAFDPANRRVAGAIYSLGSTSRQEVFVGGVYCNGLGFTAGGELIWVESYTRRLCALRADGTVRVLCELPEGQIPDGLAVATDGRIYIATCGSHGISVVSPDGEYLGLILLDERAYPSNLCFVDNALIVTDFGMEFETKPAMGRLWRVPVDAQGMEVQLGSVR